MHGGGSAPSCCAFTHRVALATLAIVHQAVVALLLLDGAVQGRLAALQGLADLHFKTERGTSLETL